MAEKLLILGAGESGVGAAILARKLGMQVYVSDGGSIAPRFRDELEKRGIPYEQGRHSAELVEAATLVVKSPGISEKAEVIKQLRKRKVPIISEIEFGYRHAEGAKIIAITGTNGKTTTTSLVYEMLRHAGFDVGLGGNIGNSFAAMVAEEPHAWYVLEVSSFQLDDIDRFRPHVAVLTNITENHLDRYNYNLSEYARAKFNMARNMQDTDFFIYGLDSEVLVQEMAKHPIHAQKLAFSRNHTPSDQHPDIVAWLDTDDDTQEPIILIDMERRKKRGALAIPPAQQKLKGKHNEYNTMAAGIVGRVLEIRNELVRESMQNFEALEHRLEKVREVNGVAFINDSKATSVNAAWYALDSIPGEQSVIWIVGGVDKGNDYGMVMDLVTEKVKAIIMLGKDVAKIQTAFNGAVKVLRHAMSMESAVQMAVQEARKGDTVLLSPACASFDMFANYEERGKRFKDCVERLD